MCAAAVSHAQSCACNLSVSTPRDDPGAGCAISELLLVAQIIALQQHRRCRSAAQGMPQAMQCTFNLTFKFSELQPAVDTIPLRFTAGRYKRDKAHCSQLTPGATPMPANAVAARDMSVATPARRARAALRSACMQRRTPTQCPYTNMNGDLHGRWRVHSHTACRPRHRRHTRDGVACTFLVPACDHCAVHARSTTMHQPLQPWQAEESNLLWCGPRAALGPTIILNF